MKDETRDQDIVHTGRIVAREIRTTATPEEVWAAWTEPDRLSEWFAESARGSVEEGGTFVWGWDSHDFESELQVLVSRPNERLVMRAPWDAGALTVIDVRVERDGDETVVRLIHSGFGEGADFDEEYRGTNSGWLMALAVLKYYLEHYFGRARQQVLEMKKAVFRYEDIPGWHHDEEKLQRWLTAEGRIPAAGERFQLRLKDGSTLTGEVLADCEQDTAVSWEELKGVLELKSWGSTAGGRWLGLRFSSWGLAPGQKAVVEALLGNALETLADLVGSSISV
jgi:uncharacterized protein YndB with AHSA1/START domain